MFDFRMNTYFEPDLYNESINPVHKTGLNDLFLNVTGLVLEFSFRVQLSLINPVTVVRS